SDLPEWLAFDDATRSFAGTPPANFNGVLEISVSASDGTLVVNDVFSLTITPVNDAPVVQAVLSDQVSAEDMSVNFQLPAGSFVDADGDDLVLSATLSDGS